MADWKRAEYSRDIPWLAFQTARCQDDVLSFGCFSTKQTEVVLGFTSLFCPLSRCTILLQPSSCKSLSFQQPAMAKRTKITLNCLYTKDLHVSVISNLFH